MFIYLVNLLWKVKLTLHEYWIFINFYGKKSVFFYELYFFIRLKLATFISLCFYPTSLLYCNSMRDLSAFFRICGSTSLFIISSNNSCIISVCNVCLTSHLKKKKNSWMLSVKIQYGELLDIVGQLSKDFRLMAL